MGNTPVIRLNKIVDENSAEILVKFECVFHTLFLMKEDLVIMVEDALWVCFVPYPSDIILNLYTKIVKII